MDIDRRNRFLRVSPKRKAKVLDAIESLQALSKSHYQYDKDEITELFNEIQLALDSTRLKFSGTSVEDRFHSLLDRDIKQMEQLKKLDPELFSQILNKFNGTYLSQYLKNKEEKEMTKDFMSLDLETFHERMDKLEDYIKFQQGTLTMWYEKEKSEK